MNPQLRLGTHMPRKGELSRASIDAGFPHQVAIPAADVEGSGYFAHHDFAQTLGACVRGHTFRRNDAYYVVFCFPTREAADAFMRGFGRGEYMTPKTRPPWIEGRR